MREIVLEIPSACGDSEFLWCIIYVCFCQKVRLDGFWGVSSIPHVFIAETQGLLAAPLFRYNVYSCMFHIQHMLLIICTDHCSHLSEQVAMSYCSGYYRHSGFIKFFGLLLRCIDTLGVQLSLQDFLSSAHATSLIPTSQRWQTVLCSSDSSCRRHVNTQVTVMWRLTAWQELKFPPQEATEGCFKCYLAESKILIGHKFSDS